MRGTIQRLSAGGSAARGSGSQQAGGPQHAGSRFSRRSDGARVEHDAHRRAEGLRREVLAEARAHGPIVSVRPANHTPHAPVLRTLLLGLRLVHVRNLLAEVEARLLAIVHALDFDDVLVLHRYFE